MQNHPSPPALNALTTGPVVLQLIADLEPGHSARDCVDAALFLKAAGGTPIVASSGGRLLHELERAGIRHYLLPLHSPNFFTVRRNIRLLLDIIDTQKADILEAYGLVPAWNAFLAARRSGRPLITHAESVYPAAGRRQDLYNSVISRADRIITNSAFLSAHLASRYGLNPNRIKTVSRGIDLFKFNPDHVTPERMATLAESWRLKDGHKVVFAPSRLLPGKGQEVLLRALAQLQRRDFVCVLAGADIAGNQAAIALEQRALDLNLESNVTMVGHCNDMPTAYMLADVVAVPTLLEDGFGRIAVEAQAMGRPVIVSDIGAQAEAVLPGETGWLLQPDNVTALAEALEQALSLTREQRLRVAAQANSHVRTHFNREQMHWATLDVYAELFGAPVPWQLAPTG